MRYLVIVIVAAIILVILLKQKPHKDENRIRTEEMIANLNENISKFTDKELESTISLENLPPEFDLMQLDLDDKKRIALAMQGKVLFSDASYIGSLLKLKHPKEQYECLRWVEKTLNDKGVAGQYRISDSVNANDIGVTLDKEVLKGLHTLRWHFRTSGQKK